MTVFHGSKTIFVHIPKTGGQAIEEYYLAKEGVKFAEREAHYNVMPHLFPGEYVPYGWCTREEWNTYDKFSVVRNPWARCVSTYKHFASKFIVSDKPVSLTFNEFLRRYCRAGWDFRRHGDPQWRFLQGLKGEVLRYEELNKHFANLPKRNVNSDRTDYRQFYDRTTRKLIQDVYARDIELLGYTFDDEAERLKEAA